MSQACSPYVHAPTESLLGSQMLCCGLSCAFQNASVPGIFGRFIRVNTSALVHSLFTAVLQSVRGSTTIYLHASDWIFNLIGNKRSPIGIPRANRWKVRPPRKFYGASPNCSTAVKTPTFLFAFWSDWDCFSSSVSLNWFDFSYFCLFSLLCLWCLQLECIREM